MSDSLLLNQSGQATVDNGGCMWNEVKRLLPDTITVVNKFCFSSQRRSWVRPRRRNWTHIWRISWVELRTRSNGRKRSWSRQKSYCSPIPVRAPLTANGVNAKIRNHPGSLLSSPFNNRTILVSFFHNEHSTATVDLTWFAMKTFNIYKGQSQEKVIMLTSAIYFLLFNE